jgi:hypothetical protein
MSFRDTYNRIRENFLREVNCIPSKFVRFKPYFLGVIKSTYIIITASSGIGKSKFTKWAYIFTPFQFIKEAPDLNISLKVFYFSLEENKDKFIRTLISEQLYQRYGLEISARDLLDMDKDNSKLSEDVLDKIETCEDYIDELLEVVEIIDYIRNPFGIFKYVREYARANGTFYFKGQVVDFNSTPNAFYDAYIPNDPEAYVIVITDHISLLTPDKEQGDLRSAMGKFSSDYCLTMRDKFGYTVVNVQQQEAAKEKQEYTIKGQSIESKLEPSLDGLGDNKTTQRDADFVYGLFGPDRYEIKEHRFYDITMLQDNYRQLSLLKDRDGTPNKRIALWFRGAINEFSELPRASDFQNHLAHYENYQQ